MFGAPDDSSHSSRGSRCAVPLCVSCSFCTSALGFLDFPHFLHEEAFVSSFVLLFCFTFYVLSGRYSCFMLVELLSLVVVELGVVGP